ncbi:hypothetical protein JCM6882_000714 [Rhodosporidiobolus microsporus]
MEPPPTELTDSNKRLSLTLPLPHGGVFAPGQPILPVVRILEYDARLEAIEVTLTGKVQVDVGSRDSNGNTLYDYRELWKRNAVFVSAPVDPTDYGDDKKKDKAPPAYSSGSDGPQDGTYRIDIPADVSTPHSSVWKSPQTGGFAAPYLITYRLEVRGRRKGFFHIDERLHVRVPIGLPAPSKEVPSQAFLSHPLKFAESDGSNLMGDLAFSLQPALHRSARIPLRLTLTAASPYARQLLTAQADNQSTFKIKYGLHRTINTYRPSGRKGLRDRRRRILKGHAELKGMSGEGGLVWEGMVEVPEGYGTVACEWVSEEYRIDIEAQSDVFVKDANGDKVPVLSIPVFLPSL